MRHPFLLERTGVATITKTRRLEHLQLVSSE
jgi:hypothetical protein